VGLQRLRRGRAAGRGDKAKIRRRDSEAATDQDVTFIGPMTLVDHILFNMVDVLNWSTATI
jgi:hypothetical protein